MESFDEKISRLFGDLAIDKPMVRELKLRNARTIPSYVEEWLVERHARPGLSADELREKIFEFMGKHLPPKTDKERVKHQLSTGEDVTLLDLFSVRVDLTKNRKFVTIPSIDESSAQIGDPILLENQDLLRGGQWGAGRLRHLPDGAKHSIHVVDFRPMQAGKVSLPGIVAARRQLTTREWIHVLLRTMGLEPGAYEEDVQLRLIQRLIPLAQNNVNMMELAPKGTGKSFVFANLSRYVWLNSGGELTEAQLFFNLSTKQVGLLGGRYDLLVLDEGQSIDFKGADNIHAKFKDYLESGQFSRGDKKIASECGLMILANIPLYDGQPMQSDYIRSLPLMFHDSALVDRFHGILAGWMIPRFKTEFIAGGYGLKADAFGEFAHQIRLPTGPEFPFGQVPALRGDLRDKKAVERLASGLSKLLMLSPEDPDYEKLVIEPSFELRARVRTQLAELDPHEFSPRLDVEFDK